MGTQGHRLAIDFGTSHTVSVLVGPDGRAQTLLFDASPLLVSAVFAGAGTAILTGADAERAAIALPAGYDANPKRRIVDGTVWLGEREIDVADLIAAVLARVAAEASRVAGRPPATVVLTYPAAWSRSRVDVLVEASGRAGLAAPQLVAEPVAAAAYFTTVLGHDLPPGKCLVVYDLGAGTFDVGVVRAATAGFEIVATDGLADIGGLDLDAAVVKHARTLTAHAAAAWGRLDWPQNPDDQRARASLWRGARQAKEQLSRHPAADLHVPLVPADVRMTREEFDHAARPLLDRTVALTVATLRSAAVPAESIAGILLVGGSSRVPLAATLLHRALRIAPTVIDQPELVVAEGALHVGAGRDVTGPPVGTLALVAATQPRETTDRVNPTPLVDVTEYSPSARRAAVVIAKGIGGWLAAMLVLAGFITLMNGLAEQINPSPVPVTRIVWMSVVVGGGSLLAVLGVSVWESRRAPLRIDEWGIHVHDSRGELLLRWKDVAAVKVQDDTLWAWPADPEQPPKTKHWDPRRETLKAVDLRDIRATRTDVRRAVLHHRAHVADTGQEEE